MMEGKDLNTVAGGGQPDLQVTVDTRADNSKRDYQEAFPSEEQLASMDKSERKRYREKRRRDRVNASFDELRALMITIDPQCSNRVDISQLELIDRSIVVIKGLLEEITRSKSRLKDMEAVEVDTKVTVAVPFVNPFENESASPHLSNDQTLGFQGAQGTIVHPTTSHVQSPLHQNFATIHPLSTEQASRFDAQFFQCQNREPVNAHQQTVNMWGQINPNNLQQPR